MDNKRTESEKLTLNLGYVDLGRIDVMVSEGFYANRSDFIRTAIRNQLFSHAATVEHTVQRNMMDLGVREFTLLDLEQAVVSGQKLIIKVVGLVRITDDVTPELAIAAIESLEVLGALQASTAVKKALVDRIS
mgnify:CR=1 FL=1